MLQSEDPSKKRAERLAEILSYTGTQVIPVEELSLPGLLSPVSLIVRINFLSYYLAIELGVKRTFDIGRKITKVE
jgi:hypothetical protein